MPSLNTHLRTVALILICSNSPQSYFQVNLDIQKEKCKWISFIAKSGHYIKNGARMEGRVENVRGIYDISQKRL